MLISSWVPHCVPLVYTFAKLTLLFEYFCFDNMSHQPHSVWLYPFYYFVNQNNQSARVEKILFKTVHSIRIALNFYLNCRRK